MDKLEQLEQKVENFRFFCETISSETQQLKHFLQEFYDIWQMQKDLEEQALFQKELENAKDYLEEMKKIIGKLIENKVVQHNDKTVLNNYAILIRLVTKYEMARQKTTSSLDQTLSLQKIYSQLNNLYHITCQTEEDLVEDFSLPQKEEIFEEYPVKEEQQGEEDRAKEEEEISFENPFWEYFTEEESIPLETEMFHHDEESNEAVEEETTPIEYSDRTIENRKKNLEEYRKKLYEVLSSESKKINTDPRMQEIKEKIDQNIPMNEENHRYYNEKVAFYTLCFNEIKRINLITEEDILDVNKNLNIPNSDMAIPEILDYLKEKRNFPFFEMPSQKEKYSVVAVSSQNYDLMNVEKNQERALAAIENPLKEKEEEKVPMENIIKIEINPEDIPKINDRFTVREPIVYLDKSLGYDMESREVSMPLFSPDTERTIDGICCQDYNGTINMYYQDEEVLENLTHGGKIIGCWFNKEGYYRIENMRIEEQKIKMSI